MLKKKKEIKFSSTRAKKQIHKNTHKYTDIHIRNYSM